MTNRWSVVLAAVAAAAGTFAVPSVAEACSCAAPSLSRSWHESSDTFKGTVVSHRIRGNVHQYVVDVVRPFSGCTVAGDSITVETNTSSAACGAELDVGDSYLLTANQDTASGAYEISLCGYNREWSTVSGEDRDFLASRPVVCERAPEDVTCADGSEPVQCFADSCSIEPGCAEAAVCEFNTCGGCEAEFYDASWTPVCE